jgi:hypothetical protein
MSPFVIVTVIVIIKLLCFTVINFFGVTELLAVAKTLMGLCRDLTPHMEFLRRATVTFSLLIENNIKIYLKMQK